MGDALGRGVVLVMSIWDDPASHMLWLDSDTPLEVDRNNSGVQRGPCSRDSGKPEDIEHQYGQSAVKYMNIKVGHIGSTTADAAYLNEVENEFLA